MHNTLKVNILNNIYNPYSNLKLPDYLNSVDESLLSKMNFETIVKSIPYKKWKEQKGLN